jgi:hypothetical protein
VHFLVTVAVLVYAPPGGGAVGHETEAVRALEAAARARGAAVVERPLAEARVAHRAGWAAEAKFAFFKRAAEAMADGAKALARVELERAERAFGQAEAVYAPELRLPGVRVLAAGAALWRGVALFELGRLSAAQAAWQRAAVLDPSVRLTEAMVRPKVAQAFVDALKRRGSAKLQVSAGDEHASSISVDDGPGRAGGADVTPGPHLVATSDGALHLVDVPAAGLSVSFESQSDGVASVIEGVSQSPSVEGVRVLHELLGADRIVVAAISLDGGMLTYAATERQDGCGSETITATRPEELLRRLDEAACRREAPVAVLEAPAIAHPRPTVAGAKGGERPAGKPRLWQRPWLWVGVVGAVGAGVVLAVSLWPRDASYSAQLDYHQFNLGYSSTR